MRRASWGVGLLGLLLFTLGLWNQPFIGFQTRFALFAQEMWRHGPSLFPTAYGEPYPDYPATSTLLIWLCSQPFGGVTKLAAVLPTAAAAALNLVLVYRLLARYSREWALAAIGFELLTVTFLAEARSISLDQLVATITLGSFYLAFTASEDQKRAPMAAIALLLAAGFAIRGPLGLVIPAGVVCSHYLLSMQWRRLLVFGSIAAALLALFSASLLDLAAHLHGAQFAHDVLRMEAAGRLSAGGDSWFGYYFTSSLVNYALAYPVAVLTVLVLAMRPSTLFRRVPRGDPRSLLVGLIGWTLVVMVGLSIPETQKIRYLLPIVPAIAALAAYPLLDECAPALRWLGSAARKLLLALPGLIAVAVWAMTAHASVQAPFVLTYALLAGCQLTAIAVQLLAAPRLKTLGLLASAVLAVWTTNLLVAEPVALQLHDTRRFVQELETLRQQHPGELVFFRIGKDAAAIKYVVKVNADLRPLFVSEPAALDALGRPAYVIAEDNQLPRLRSVARLASVQPVLHGRFDHVLFTVFYLE